MWINKRQYEDLLLSHKREVDILTNWVENLQAQLGAQFSPRPEPEMQHVTPMSQEALYAGDEEQDMLDALDMGLISKDQFDEWKRRESGKNVEVFG